MRVLVLSNLYPNPWQPRCAAFNRQQFGAMASQHSLHIIAPIAWTDELIAGRKSLPGRRRQELNGIVVEHPRYLFPPKVLRNWYGHFFRRSVRRCFEQAVAEFRPDVVLGSWAYPDGWAAVDLGHRAGLPVVVKVHGSDIHQLDAYPSRKQGTQEALSRANGVITPSKDLAKRVIELGAKPDRVCVVYNGVDRSLFHPASRSEARQRLALPQDTPIVLFVGNLVSVKGVDVLMKACEGQSDFTCYVIGEGPLASYRSDRVKLLGPKPHNELPDWYAAANVVAIPSRSEGVPNVLLEAIACGTPFIASNVGGIPEVAHFGTGKLVPPDDPDALVQAIRDTLSNNSRAEPATSIRSFEDSAAELADVLQQATCRDLQPVGSR